MKYFIAAAATALALFATTGSASAQHPGYYPSHRPATVGHHAPAHVASGHAMTGGYGIHPGQFPSPGPHVAPIRLRVAMHPGPVHVPAPQTTHGRDRHHYDRGHR